MNNQSHVLEKLVTMDEEYHLKHWETTLSSTFTMCGAGDDTGALRQDSCKVTQQVSAKDKTNQNLRDSKAPGGMPRLEGCVVSGWRKKPRGGWVGIQHSHRLMWISLSILTCTCPILATNTHAFLFPLSQSPTCWISPALLCLHSFAPTNASSWDAYPIQPHLSFKANPRSTICWPPFVLFIHSFKKHQFSRYYVSGNLWGTGDSAAQIVIPCPEGT